MRLDKVRFDLSVIQLTCFKNGFDLHVHHLLRGWYPVPTYIMVRICCVQPFHVHGESMCPFTLFLCLRCLGVRPY